MDRNHPQGRYPSERIEIHTLSWNCLTPGDDQIRYHRICTLTEDNSHRINRERSRKDPTEDRSQGYISKTGKIRTQSTR